jgi:hypothetical protein
MTASKTPRLGLMNPVGSDAFVTTDFSSTFGIIDSYPGVLSVPNAASRPTNWTSAQHGMWVYQADLNIVWSWNQPTSGSSGSWRRVGNVGLLGQSGASGLITTTTTTYSSGVQVAALTVTVPGGRPIMVSIGWDVLGNTYNKAVVSYWENNVLIASKAVYGQAPTNSGTPVSNGTWQFARDVAPSASLTLATKVTVAAFNAAPANGGGTTSAQGVAIAIWET